MNFCCGMLYCLCSALVKLNLIVEAEHINRNKYSNSYTRKCHLYTPHENNCLYKTMSCKENESTIPHVKWNGDI
jgi:hypothetical protein